MTSAPHDQQAEEAVLGSLLLDAECRVDLEERDFFLEANQLVYRAMVATEHRDQITVAHELLRNETLQKAGGVSYLSYLVSITPTSLHAGHYAQIVKDCSRNRDLIEIAGQIANIGYTNAAPDGNVEASQKLVNKLAEQKKSSAQSITALANKALDRYETLTDGTSGIPTGIVCFDKFTGGIRNGDYIIIAARAGMGKSSLALQIANHLALFKKVLFFSLEMSSSALTDKLVSSSVSIPMNTIARGNYTDATLDGLVKGAQKISALKLNIVCGSMTTQKIRNLITQTRMEYGVDVVFVDYLQLLMDKSNGNANERIGNISREISSIAKEFDLPVIALSQLNRACDSRDDKRPKLWDLRESGSLEQDADMVLFLYRDNYYSHLLDDKAELIIAKDRLTGKMGKLPLVWKAKRGIYCGD